MPEKPWTALYHGCGVVGTLRRGGICSHSINIYGWGGQLEMSAKAKKLMSVDQEPAASDDIQYNSVRCAFNETLKVNVVVFLFGQIQGCFWPKVRPIDSVKYIAQNLRRGDNALLHKLKSLLGCTVERGNNLIGGWSCFLLIVYVFNVHVLTVCLCAFPFPLRFTGSQSLTKSIQSGAIRFIWSSEEN